MRLRLSVAASVLSAFAAVAIPGIANARVHHHPRHSYSLTINASPNPIIAGEGVLIYGRLTGPDVGDQTIVLYHHIAESGRGYTVIGRTTTNPDGYYEFTRVEGIVYTNRAWYVQGPDGSRSRTIHEHVAALVTLSPNVTSANAKQPIVFTGHVTPNHPYERVFLQQQVGPPSGNDWKTIASAYLDGPSNYRISYTWRAGGAYTVRTLFKGDPRNVASESTPVSVTIQPMQVVGFTIGASPGTIISYGSSVTISGILDKPGTTIGESGTMVQLLGRTAGTSTYVPLATTTTGSDGSYSFSQTPAHNTWYYVQTLFVTPGRHTARLFEGVRDAVTFTGPSTAVVGQHVEFTGTVLPDKAGDVVYLQRLGKDGNWHTIEERVISYSSTFQFGWTFGDQGTIVLRAAVPGDATNLFSWSAPMTVTVTLPPVQALPTTSK